MKKGTLETKQQMAHLRSLRRHTGGGLGSSKHSHKIGKGMGSSKIEPMTQDIFTSLCGELIELQHYLSNIDRVIHESESSWDGNPISYVQSRIQSRIDLRPLYKERASVRSKMKNIEAQIDKHALKT